MAKGRIIHTDTNLKRWYRELSSDTSRLGYMLYYTTADRDGRLIADPVVVKARVFPARDDITVEQVDAMLNEWPIERYEVNGEQYAVIKDFKDTQKGLRYEREAPSEIPPMPELVRSDDGVTPQIPSVCGGIKESNINEIKLSEDNTPLNPPRGEDQSVEARMRRFIFKYADRFNNGNPNIGSGQAKVRNLVSRPDYDEEFALGVLSDYEGQGYKKAGYFTKVIAGLLDDRKQAAKEEAGRNDGDELVEFQGHKIPKREAEAAQRLLDRRKVA